MATPTDSPSVPVLGYAAPAVFFRGEYRCRSAGGFLAIVIVTAMGGAFLWFSCQPSAATVSGWLERYIRAAFLVLGIGCFALAGYGAWLVIAGRRWDVLISEDGITRQGVLYPWQEIRSFSADLVRNRVSMQFRATTGLGLRRALEVTPLLAVEEYRALALVLVEKVVPRHPELKVVVEPRSDG